MTKLNITNKRLYKLKKHRNQSKKNFPKKRKNRRRRARRGGGKSFRKRRKYNIKNNSIKIYQKGGQGGTTGQKFKDAYLIVYLDTLASISLITVPAIN